MNNCEIRQILLSFKVFEENEFFDKYINLIISNNDTKYEKHKTQNHHIVPLHVYKYLSIAADNSKSNLVTLHYTDHILAHFYLFHCSKDKIVKRANYVSLQYIIHNPDVPKSEHELLIKLPEYQKMYNEYCTLNSELQKGVRAGERNPFFGKKHSEATRKKMREHHANFSKENSPRYGKHLSDEAKRCISAHNTGRVKTEEEKQKRIDTINAHGGYSWWITDEYRKKLSESLKGKNTHSKGRIFINDGINNKLVTSDSIGEYLNSGWVRGRIITDDARQKYKKNRPPSTAGHIWVTDGVTNKSINPEELSTYMQQNYYRGRTLVKPIK